jgi:hypothetical protein
MRSIFVLASMIMSCGTALAQESCDVRSTFGMQAGNAVFQQLMFCGDSDPVITLTCKPGASKVKASLPIVGFTQGIGETITVALEIGGSAVNRRLRIVSATNSEISLDLKDALWAALSEIGTDIPVTWDDASTSIGLLEESRGNFEEWKATCGL